MVCSASTSNSYDECLVSAGILTDRLVKKNLNTNVIFYHVFLIITSGLLKTHIHETDSGRNLERGETAGRLQLKGCGFVFGGTLLKCTIHFQINFWLTV